MRRLITLFLLASAFAAGAQPGDTTTGRLSVFSFLGLSFIDNNYDPASGTSVQATTGLEVKVFRFSGVGLMVSFDSYGFKKSGTGYNLNGSLKASSLVLFYRYKFGSRAWQPYLRAGGGAAWLSVPVVTVAQGTTSFVKSVQGVSVVLAEAGLQAHLLSRYSLLFAVEKKWMGKSSLLDDTSLRTIGFKIGVISSF
jgi:hypothetical protein